MMKFYSPIHVRTVSRYVQWKFCIGSFPLLCILFLQIISLQAFAQNQVVSGKILSSQDRSPLPGVNVLVKGTTTGVVSDANGTYSISIPGEEAVLVFTFVGYTSQEVKVGDRTTVDIELAPSLEALSEVIVTGYSSQLKRDITGAVSSVDAKELLAVPASNVGQALQGRVAGVVVGNENSPGGGVMIRIRGFGTINDNSPLFVVDGMPTKGNLNTLNLTDIESVQVLKDASAASIYGSRAGSGVIIVTTKRGKPGKPVFTYDAYYGIQQAHKLPDLLNTQQFADLTWESRINSGTGLVNGNPFHTQFGNGPAPTIPAYILPAAAKADDPRVDPINYSNKVDDPDFGKTKFLITKANREGTNWADVIFDPAPIQNHQLGVSGGGDNGTYAVVLNYFDQKGIMKYTSTNRYSLRFNSQSKVNNWFRFGENFQVAYAERVVQVSGNQNENNPLMFAYRMHPIVPVYDIKGNFAGTKSTDVGNARNPLALLVRNKDDINKDVRLLGNAYAEVDILKNLTARTSFGVDYTIYNFRDYSIRDIESASANASNSLNVTNNYEWSWTWYNTLTYSKSFGLHKLQVLLGNEAIKGYFEQFTGRRANFVSDDIDNQYLNAGDASTATNGGTASDYALASEFAKINYSLNDKYLLDLTARRDRSSRVAPSARVGYFPAASAGWRLSQESFMRNLTFLDELKLRAGWGLTGNQSIGNYNYFSVYGSNATVSFYDLNGTGTSSVLGYELNQFGNVLTKWEKTASTNIGIDVSLWKGKLTTSVDWFYRETKDMFFPVASPSTLGAGAEPFQNIGVVLNKGLEFEVNYRTKALNDKVTFDVGVNLSTYRNKVLVTDGKDTPYFGFGNSRTGVANVTREGQPLASFYGYTIDGIFQTDEEAKAHPAQFGGGDNNKAGQFRFRDINRDGVINANDQGIIGNPHPDFTYGINVNIGYKNFSLNLFGQGVQGNEIFNRVKFYTDFQGFQANRSTRMLYESWRPGKTDAILPQLRTNDVISSSSSTYFLEDGSYLRIKNIQLGYTLPTFLTSKMRLGQVQFYVQAQNWFTFTNYSGLDPEINLRAYGPDSDRQIGIDEGAYPAYKALLLGVHLSF